MVPDSVERQRITALEELLEIEYEKLSSFERELTISASAAEKFDLQQRLKRDLLPDIRKHEAEYAELLADCANLASIPTEQAESAAADLIHAVQHLENLRDSNRPEEIKHLLVDIRKKLDDPGKTAAAKLRVSLPIIPLIASYDMEMDTEAVLVRVWRRVKSLFRSTV